MRSIFLIYLAGCLATAGLCQSVPSPLQQRVHQTDDVQVYDTKAWKVYTGAPVRSTPLLQKDFLYAGNAKGEFFAMEKKTGRIKWTFTAPAAIHSSAIASDTRIFFTDNTQTLYALNEADGSLLWKFSMGKKRPYSWRYDYYYSSPVLQNGKLLVGGDDGFFYAIDPLSGQLLWKFECRGIVRGSATVSDNRIYFGDTEATLYALNLSTGGEEWQYRINGDTMNNDKYGFDRRAIVATPVVAGNKLIFGARDGYLYCINTKDGSVNWKADHRVSWVISTVAIKDTIVVTGTSDGRFVQALNLETGNELWKYRTPLAVWASPLIVNDKVYAGCFDGQLLCLDLQTGRRISQFKTGGKITSSPVWDAGLLYVGSDDGNIYAISGHADRRSSGKEQVRYVFYEENINTYFRNGSDILIRNYLRGSGYKVINSDSLIKLLPAIKPGNAVVVFASSYFPPAFVNGGAKSALRKFLDGGGRVVLAGINPLLFKIDEKTKQPYDYNRHACDTILNLDYGAGDTRTFMGDFASFPTEAGRELGLPDYWTSSVFIEEGKVDRVLGRNENGLVSAFVKNYLNGGRFVQIWMDADAPDRLDAILKAAETQL